MNCYELWCGGRGYEAVWYQDWIKRHQAEIRQKVDAIQLAWWKPCQSGLFFLHVCWWKPILDSLMWCGNVGCNVNGCVFMLLFEGVLHKTHTSADICQSGHSECRHLSVWSLWCDHLVYIFVFVHVIVWECVALHMCACVCAWREYVFVRDVSACVCAWRECMCVRDR
jgi:hypothetical protein